MANERLDLLRMALDTIEPSEEFAKFFQPSDAPMLRALFDSLSAGADEENGRRSALALFALSRIVPGTDLKDLFFRAASSKFSTVRNTVAANAECLPQPAALELIGRMLADPEKSVQRATVQVIAPRLVPELRDALTKVRESASSPYLAAKIDRLLTG